MLDIRRLVKMKVETESTRNIDWHCDVVVSISSQEDSQS